VASTIERESLIFQNVYAPEQYEWTVIANRDLTELNVGHARISSRSL
jgi:hypothetical protein